MAAMATLATPARAGGSAPVLSLTAVDAMTSPDGSAVVQAAGAFNFEDVVEDVFGLSLIVFHGTRFVRYDQAGNVSAGDSPLVADGIDLAEIETVLSSGAPIGPPAALASLERDRVTVVLPADFPSGDASVLLGAVFDGDSFASNALVVTLP
jgi:hypothetical protein